MMHRLYTIFGCCALAVFAWAQYNGYGLFDAVAAGRTHDPAGARSIYHK
ncbi:hypothetical protein AGMMS49545_16330 [Betaproteobacteria bacterium]|nr:hypothetical protein AGMMS49545_16330 [Betaproteobacteria bacterium]GHU46823.1 hypothetical protein AGMMS50289_21090 [Betaproteobacteria bacterium]